MRARSTAVAVLVALAVLAPVALASPGNASPVLVDADAREADIHLRSTENATFGFTLFNLNTADQFYVSTKLNGFSGWTVQSTPDRFFVDPRASVHVLVTLTAPASAREFNVGAIEFHIKNPQTGAESVESESVKLTVTNAARVLGLFANPLPAPLDSTLGVFALDIAFWAVFGVAAFVAGDGIVRYLTRYARADTTKGIIHKLRWPVFGFTLLLGLKQSVDVLPENGATSFVRRYIALAVVGAAGIYLVYRLVDSGLYYYTIEVAPKTATRLDDVLVPFIRKVTLIVIVIFAIFFALSLVGIDPSVIFAGAGIAGLVIAFAAQDTLSNFFSGIFLILDGPFLEGDEIQIESGEICRVETIGLRSTRLYHYRSHELIILPNNQLASRRIVNLSGPDTQYRLVVKFGVAYGTDVERMRRLVTEEILKLDGIVRDKIPKIWVMNFGDSSIDCEARVFIENHSDNYRSRLSSEIREAIYRTLNANAIEIPFPQRVLHVRGDASRSVPVTPLAPAQPAKPERP